MPPAIHPPRPPRVVLHLVDRTTGGVPVAVRSYIANTPAGLTHVVASPHFDGAPAPVWREGNGVGEIRHAAWDVTTSLRALSSLRRIVADVRPDVVHAHSSFPGVYSRVLGTGRARLVYTPHCFAFERRDIGAAARMLYRAIERILRPRADVLAAGGPGEALAAAGLGYPEDRLLVIPNVPSVSRAPSARPRSESAADTVTVGMLGRWAPQKDPDAFVSVVRGLRAELPGVNVRAKWIGGGEGAEDAPDDVEVTGWQSPEGVAAELAGLDVYVHTAAWEAAVAIAVLDAYECGIPILARSIPAMPELPPAVRLDTGMPRLVEAVRAGRLDHWAADNRARWGRYLAGRFTPPSQRVALERVWG
ncbi:glycosyltransferase family 4 protein [Microbacterium sp. NPDC089180]|uniref:glycosyltransferase family 4 protein n=1 Tax=unclassified Microbacterium TaxID=2609290 RepID=UPI003424BCD7